MEPLLQAEGAARLVLLQPAGLREPHRHRELPLAVEAVLHVVAQVDEDGPPPLRHDAQPVAPRRLAQPAHLLRVRVRLA